MFFETYDKSRKSFITTVNSATSRGRRMFEDEDFMRLFSAMFLDLLDYSTDEQTRVGPETLNGTAAKLAIEAIGTQYVASLSSNRRSVVDLPPSRKS